MIIYSKTLWGLPLLTRLYGSALPRALGPALVSGLITLCLLAAGDHVAALWSHPYAYQPFVLLVSFVLTFRSNYAYQRHWEAYSNVQSMTARWLDAATQIILFDRHPQAPDGAPQPARGARGAPAAEGHAAFVGEVVHLLSLMHGLAAAALRRDADLGNLSRHRAGQEAPPSDPALRPQHSGAAAAAAAAASGAPGEGPGACGSGTSAGSLGRWAASHLGGGGEGDIVGRVNWRDVIMLRGSSRTLRKYNAATPLPVVAGLAPEEAAALGCLAEGGWGDPGARGLATDIGWGGAVDGRWPGGAPARSGGSDGGSGGRLWGLWRSAQSEPAAPRARSRSFSEGMAEAAAALKAAAAHAAAAPPPRPRSPAARRRGSGNGSANGAATPPGPRGERASRRFRVSVNRSCCALHLAYMDRPLVVLAWLQQLLLERQAAGGLRLPAPILARVYTSLSDGMHAYEQCRKLADTPFPFPWAQFVLVMLLLFTATLPLLVLAYVPNSALVRPQRAAGRRRGRAAGAARGTARRGGAVTPRARARAAQAVVLCVVSTATFWAVNEVARDVEDPFLYEPNDMPLANAQFHFNTVLLALASVQRPARAAAAPVLLPSAAAAAAGAASSMGLRVGSALPGMLGGGGSAGEHDLGERSSWDAGSGSDDGDAPGAPRRRRSPDAAGDCLPARDATPRASRGGAPAAGGAWRQQQRSDDLV
ncbi:hypothetical protein HT031_005804 [Scenedesmus sp. PABB004]|nr:hypothetical protein HT031_005804 [Scenedesmus sp. PABB004]